MTETMEEYLPAYQDIYGEGIDPETYKGLAKLQLAQMFLGWADPSKGTSFGERAVKSAQETIPNITALAMQKAKEESESGKKAKIGAMEATREDIKEAKKEIRDIENEERRMKVKRGEYFDVVANTTTKISEYDAATQPERYTIPPVLIDDATGQWTEDGVTHTANVWKYQYPDGPRYVVPLRPGEKVENDPNTYALKPPSGWRFLPKDIAMNMKTIKATSPQDIFISPEKRSEHAASILGMKNFIEIAKVTKKTFIDDPTRAGVTGKARTLWQEGTQITKDIVKALGEEADVNVGTNIKWQEKLNVPINERSKSLNDNIFSKIPGESLQDKIDWAKENYFTKDKAEAEKGFKTHDPTGALAKNFGIVMQDVTNATSDATIEALSQDPKLEGFFNEAQQNIADAFNSGFTVVPAANPRNPLYDERLYKMYYESGDADQIAQATREATLKARNIMSPVHEESTKLWGKKYDRELAKNRVRINTIVYGLARARKSSGRLNLDDIKRASEALDVFWISGAGAVASLEEAITEMQAFEDKLKINWRKSVGTDFDLDYGFKKTDPLKSVPSEKKKTIQEAIDKKLGK